MPRVKPIPRHKSALPKHKGVTAALAPLDPSAALGLAPWETAMLSTPEAHAQFEGAALPPPPPAQEPFALPWEKGRAAIDEAKRRIGPELTPEAFYAAYVSKTAAQVEEEMTHAQRSARWLEDRALNVRGSEFGSAAGSNPYQSANIYVRNKVFPGKHGFRGNSFTEYGTQHEKHAEEAFETFLKARVGMHSIDHPTLIKSHADPWIGASPDGVLRRGCECRGSGECTVGCKDGVLSELVEYKCAARARNSTGGHHPYKRFPHNVPPYYLDQVMGSMHLLRKHGLFNCGGTVRAWFVCWTPAAFWVTHVPYCEHYALKLEARLKALYFQRLLPAYVTALKDADAAEPPAPLSASSAAPPSASRAEPLSIASAAAVSAATHSVKSAESQAEHDVGSTAARSGASAPAPRDPRRSPAPIHAGPGATGCAVAGQPSH